MRALRISRSRVIVNLCLLLMFASVQPGFGQEPARPLYAPALISLVDARNIIEGAIAYARERNLSMAVVVMDHSGNVVSSDRMDGAPFRNVHEAEGKAYASALYGRPTQELGEFEATRPDRYFGIINMYPGKVYLVGGGLRCKERIAEYRAAGVDLPLLLPRLENYSSVAQSLSS